jgi:adenylosuccinate lyase
MIALREKDTLQIGRTHGQHAEPVTFGLAVAGFASRLGGRIQQLERTAKALPGKFSGPVGAYNAAAVVLENPLGFEATVLSGLGLKPAPSSSQIVEPEPLADLGHAAVSAFGVLANLSDDFRHLQRSELAEVFEFFESAQVGSSTMPHKRNPMNFENVKSFWKAFMPRMTTLYMDQVSEHQRDLTNSASQRFFPEMLAGLYLSSTRLNRVLGKIKVDTARMRHNFDLSKNAILAEPLYILLALHQHPDAHEAVRQLTILAFMFQSPMNQTITCGL